MLSLTKNISASVIDLQLYLYYFCLVLYASVLKCCFQCIYSSYCYTTATSPHLMHSSLIKMHQCWGYTNC